MIRRAEHPRQEGWILFAPYIPTPIAQRLQAAQINYVDAQGNCRVVLDKAHMAVIEGRRPAAGIAEAEFVVGPKARQVLFALLAKPELLGAPVRQLATAAGVGKTIAAQALTRLQRDGILVDTGQRYVFPHWKRALERWLAIYADTVRPRMIVGQFRANAEPGRPFEQWLEGAMQNQHDWRWAYGGAAAAYRLVAHFRGDETVIHLEGDPDAFARRARLVPAARGPVTIHRALGPAAFAETPPHTADPLLVYSELLANGAPRELELAEMVREQCLPATQ